MQLLNEEVKSISLPSTLNWLSRPHDSAWPPNKFSVQQLPEHHANHLFPLSNMNGCIFPSHQQHCGDQDYCLSATPLWIDNLSLQVKQRGCVWLPWKHRKLSCFHSSLSFFCSSLLTKQHPVKYLCISLSATNRWNNLTSVNNYFVGAQEHRLAHWALVAVQGEQKQKQQELFQPVKSSDLIHRGNLLGRTTWFNKPNFLRIILFKTQRKDWSLTIMHGREGIRNKPLTGQGWMSLWLHNCWCGQAVV